MLFTKERILYKLHEDTFKTNGEGAFVTIHRIARHLSPQLQSNKTMKLGHNFNAAYRYKAAVMSGNQIQSIFSSRYSSLS